MKKNKMMRLASVMLVLTLLSTCAISGSFAKFTTTAEANDTAVVAAWSVSTVLGSASFGTTGTQLNLFDESKIFDTNGVNSYTAAGTVDSDVRKATSGSNAIIAPGTWGKFTYTIKNDSDVNAKYKVDYTVDEKSVPLEWSTDGSTWTDDLANVTTAVAINMPATKGTATTADRTVYWRWAYGDSVDDTALGTAATLAQPTVKIAVTIEQVD